mgnify:CR=1 FL=1
MDDVFYNVYLLEDEVMISNHKRDPWRNGGASDSRSKGCVFDSRRVHLYMPRSCVVMPLEHAMFWY